MNNKILIIAALLLCCGFLFYIGFSSSKQTESYQVKDIILAEANPDDPQKYITPPACDGNNVMAAEAFISPTFVHSGEGNSKTPYGDSIISIKNWIEKKDGKWIPRMEITTISNKIVRPKGKVLIMAVCPPMVK